MYGQSMALLHFKTCDDDIFLQSINEKLRIKRKRPPRQNATQRKSSFQVYVLKHTDKFKIYKKAVTSLYEVATVRLHRLCDLLNERKSSKDNRWCHPKANTVPPEIWQKNREHILCFPRKMTHYAGKDI